jgi:transforming growth factor-beta-induced protein
LASSSILAQQPCDAGHAKASPGDIVAVATSAGSFKTLVAAVQAAGLVETLQGKGPFTVFAPNDDAFAKLGKQKIAELLQPAQRDTLRSILTYHVVAGSMPAAKVVTQKSLATVQGSDLAVAAGKQGVTIGAAKVVATDVMASNGLIHVIDTVLLPPEGPGNIVSVATKAGSFSTLLAAASAADLAETLAGKGPLTVFAPNDAAFAKLPEGTVTDLLKPENKGKLAAILKRHVVAGKVTSAEVVKLESAETLNGTVPIRVDEGTVMVGGAKVVTVDVMASNGVIHVIDTVLLPH